MTEQEAKQKWCPHVRVGALSGNGFNRDNQAGDLGIDYPLYKCIASDCMMWQWNQLQPGRKVPKKEAGGYCGLANKP